MKSRKEKLKESSRNPNFIPGIYNYCDRWCEKCYMASQCLQFEANKIFAQPSHAADLKNKQFWDHLSEIFHTTIEMLEDQAEELGIDLDITHYVQQIEGNVLESVDKQTDIIFDATNYGEKVSEWFSETAEELVDLRKKELHLHSELDIPVNDTIDELVKIENAIEVIMWYHFFISTKLRRANYSRENTDNSLIEIAKYDSDGSAKVALIAIERSIGAWGKLLDYIPEKEDDIFDYLKMLHQLKEKVENEFPDACNFVRPGFDTNE